MAAWTPIDTNNLLPGEPWTSAKANAVYENPTAMAEGASGAPTVEVAWHFLEYVGQGTLTSGNITFTSNLTNFRAVKVVMVGSVNVLPGTPSIGVQLTGGANTPIGEILLTGAGTLNFERTIENVDAGDSSFDRKGGACIFSGTGVTDGISVDFVTYSTAHTGIQITTTDSEIAGRFALYGIKRTLP